MSIDNIAQPEGSRHRRAGSDESTLFVGEQTSEVAEWGFEVDQDKEHIQFVKLLLDPHQKLPEYVSRTDLEARLKRAGKTAVQAAADYLFVLKQHVLEQLEGRFSAEMCATTKIEFVLTVPAVWSDAAKDATRKAAELAGMNENDNLSMITEPEAAALCALKTVAGVNANQDDVWIICDAGGGTYGCKHACGKAIIAQCQFCTRYANIFSHVRYCRPDLLRDKVTVTIPHRRSCFRRW